MCQGVGVKQVCGVDHPLCLLLAVDRLHHGDRLAQALGAQGAARAGAACVCLNPNSGAHLDLSLEHPVVLVQHALHGGLFLLAPAACVRRRGRVSCALQVPWEA